jgi:hypothetical protein
MVGDALRGCELIGTAFQPRDARHYLGDDSARHRN